MTKVVDNIISNAVKYSPEGGNITLKVEKRMSEIVVSIRDEGIGIANDKLEKIFNRFYRADKARTRQLGGTGLGLAITLEIIDMHYGRIDRKSTRLNSSHVSISYAVFCLKKKR